MEKKINENENLQEGKPLSEIKSVQLRKYSLIIMLILTLMLTAFGVYLYMTTSYERYKTVQSDHGTSSEELMHKMKQMLDAEKERQSQLPPSSEPSSPPPAEANVTEQNQTTAIEPSVESNETHAPVIVHEDESKLSEVNDYQRSVKESGKPARPNEVVRKKYPAGTTPKLAIIIDDVSFAWQTRSIKEIPYKVTPSFFPPTKGHPDTVRLSHEFEFRMIHLPMESKNYSSPEPETLNAVDSSEVIEKRIKRIKELFPEIIYYNNHTGGSYTADYNAMDRLVKIMKENGLVFVDSRTAGNSKAPEITKKYDMFLYSRDVFLDNSLDKNLIRTQLKDAVMKAKKHGYAIAIGHPHKNTLEVLKESQDLFEGIDLVYLKDL